MKKPKIAEGEWKFVIDESSHQVRLMSSTGDQVIDFVRYGFQRAQPRFYTDGIMIKAEELSVVVEGREHHKSWYKEIDHPIADLLESVPNLIDALIDIRKQIKDCKSTDFVSAIDTSKVYNALKKAGVTE